MQGTPYPHLSILYYFIYSQYLWLRRKKLILKWKVFMSPRLFLFYTIINYVFFFLKFEIPKCNVHRRKRHKSYWLLIRKLLFLREKFNIFTKFSHVHKCEYILYLLFMLEESCEIIKFYFKNKYFLNFSRWFLLQSRFV